MGFYIQVNAITPGFEKTKISAALWEQAEKIRATHQMICQKRFAEPGEIGDVAFLLASKESSIMAGATIDIDSGQRAGTSGKPNK